MYRVSDNYQIDFYQYFFLKITFSNKQKNWESSTKYAYMYVLERVGPE